VSDDPMHNGHAPLAHAQVQDMLAAYLADETTPAERAAIAHHLSACAPCRKALAEAQRIHSLLGTLRAAAASAPRQSSLADAVMQHIGLTLSSSSAGLARGDDEQKESEIASLAQFGDSRPVSGEARVMGESSNSAHTARRGDRAPRPSPGVISPMQTPTTSDTSVTATSKPRPRSAPFVAVAAAMLVALLAVGLFLTHKPQPVPTVGMTSLLNKGATPPAGSYAPRPPEVTPVPSAQTPIQSDIKSYSSIQPLAGSSTILPKNPTSVIRVGQSIYIVMRLNKQVRAGDKVSAEWFFNDINITPDLLRSEPTCCSKTVPQTGKPLQVYFALKPTAIGAGKAEIFYNGKLAYIILFTVVS